MGMIILNGKEYTSMPKDGFPPLIYSDEEREVGVWRDGKPLYAKTINLPKSVLTSKDMNIQHGISNLDKIIDISGVMRADNQNPIVTGYQWGSDWGCSIGDVTSTTFYLRMGGSRYSAVTEVSVTLLYTKTTDTPGSGTWNQQGGYAHHYSTDEKIVGTWVNGKPIYEKSFANIQLTRWQWTQIAHGISNIDAKLSMTGLVVRDSDGWSVLLDYYESSSAYISSEFNSTNVEIKVNISSGSYKANIIVRYTKTTD